MVCFDLFGSWVFFYYYYYLRSVWISFRWFSPFLFWFWFKNIWKCELTLFSSSVLLLLSSLSSSFISASPLSSLLLFCFHSSCFVHPTLSLSFSAVMLLLFCRIISSTWVSWGCSGRLVSSSCWGREKPSASCCGPLSSPSRSTPHSFCLLRREKLYVLWQSQILKTTAAHTSDVSLLRLCLTSVSSLPCCSSSTPSLECR